MNDDMKDLFMPNEDTLVIVQKELTDHQKAIGDLMLEYLDGLVGFPDTPRRLRGLIVSYAEFSSTKPHKGNEHTPDWKRGIIPATWLMETIRRSCEFMPAPIVAREIYCVEFPPLDKIEPRSLPQVCRRREAKEEE
jgi:hypothetical protein